MSLKVTFLFNGLLMRYKKIYILSIFFILIIISPFHRVFNSPKNIIIHSYKIIQTSLDERRNFYYAHMGFKYIKTLTTNISNKMNPLLVYKNWGYGVTALLSGLRLKTNPNIIIIIDLDKKLPNSIPNYFTCNEKVFFDNSFKKIKSCNFKKPIYITGITLDRDLEKEEFIKITFMSKEKILNKFKVDKDDLILSAKLNSYKIPYRNTKLYEVIKKENLQNGNLKIIVESEKKLNFFLTGFSQNSEPDYKINDHYILGWDKEDARNYLAIDKSVITDNLEFKDKETCIMLFEIFKNKPNHNPLRNNNDCL